MGGVMKYVKPNNYDFPALFRPARAVDGEQETA